VPYNVKNIKLSSLILKGLAFKKKQGNITSRKLPIPAKQQCHTNVSKNIENTGYDNIPNKVFTKTGIYVKLN